MARGYGFKKLRRNCELGPKREVIREFVQNGRTCEELKCGHVIEAQPLVGQHKKICRRCPDCCITWARQLRNNLHTAKQRYELKL
jgi:hypothetical protein